MVKLIILGSGTFFVNDKVSASASVLQINDTNILIDCGPGTLVKLAQAGFNPGDIDYVFITHLHPDHTSDLFPFFMNFRLDDVFIPGSTEKYPVFYGPKLLSKYMLEYSHLTQLHSVDNWDKIKFLPFEKEFNINDVRIKTYNVVHKAFFIDTEAYALRFETLNKVIAFSGDSADCEGVRNVCKNADLFICDTSLPKSSKKNDIHMNTQEIGEIAQESNVKKIVLNHLYPYYTDIDLEGEVKENFSGEIAKAVDLDVIEI